MLSQNFTVSQLTLKMTTAFSPILYLPMLSLSTASNFYFSKIISSYSFSPFINGHKFNFLSVEYSKFSYYLSNVLRINGEEPNYPFEPVFSKFCNESVIENRTIQIIGCSYSENSQKSSIYSKDANLSVFTSDFNKCSSSSSGGGIYHENGYFRTDSNNFRDCKSNECGGGFYHKTGPIKIFRSSFSGNFARNGGSHFCIENYTENFIFIDFCFFSSIAGDKREDLIRVRRNDTNNNNKIFVNPSNCRFNITKNELENYMNPNYTILAINEDEAKDTNKFAPLNSFPGLYWPMRNRPSGTFKPTNFFSPTECFSETANFTFSDTFTQSSNFLDSSPFTPSANFTMTLGFSQSNAFSYTNAFSSSINFTQSQKFSHSSCFSQSNDFLATERFSGSSAFTPSIPFTLSESFTPHRTRTPSYSPIPTRSGGPVIPAPTPSHTFSLSNTFTQSNSFTASNFLPTDYLEPAIAATKKPLKGGSIMILLIVLGALLLLLGLIANIILCVQMVQAGEIIITQRM